MKTKDMRGITIISLVVTIVILLILSWVTITMLLGNNEIIKQTAIAKEKSKNSQEKENIEMAIISSKIENIHSLEITKSSLEEALKNQFGNNVDFFVKDNKDGSFTIKSNNTGHMYYVNDSGNIIEDNNIIKIKNANELKNFRDEVNKGNTYEGKYVCLTNNINLDINEEWNPIGVYAKDSPSPDSEDNIPFMGTFDGGGYEINGIYINSTEKVKGLFAFIKNATIKNLKIGKNCNINGYLGTASIIGYAYDKSIIYNCSNNSDVYGVQNTGGVVGILVNSIVKNSYNTANISGNNNIGGIVGYATSNSEINKCHNAGEINGKENYIGGISGYTYINSKVDFSYNKGNVNGKRYSRRNYGIYKGRFTDKQML